MTPPPQLHTKQQRGRASAWPGLRRSSPMHMRLACRHTQARCLLRIPGLGFRVYTHTHTRKQDAISEYPVPFPFEIIMRKWFISAMRCFGFICSIFILYFIFIYFIMRKRFVSAMRCCALTCKRSMWTWLLSCECWGCWVSRKKRPAKMQKKEKKTCYRCKRFGYCFSRLVNITHKTSFVSPKKKQCACVGKRGLQIHFFQK